MEALLNYFETIPSPHRSLILVGGLTLFWLIEGGIPLFNFKYNKWKHALPNLFFTLTTFFCQILLELEQTQSQLLGLQFDALCHL